MVEGSSTPTLEALTYSPADPARDRWLQRTLSQTGAQLGQLRDRLFASLPLQRHHLVLDLNARSGLLTWEAVRQVPEGRVFARVETDEDFAALTEQAALLPELNRPVVFQSALEDLPDALATIAAGVAVEAVVGRHVFSAIAPTPDLIQTLVSCVAPQQGRLALVEAIPRNAQRIGALVPADSLDSQLRDRWKEAEEHLYTNAADPRFGWDSKTLVTQLEKAGLMVNWADEVIEGERFISEKLCDRWFAPNPSTSYRSKLAAILSPQELTEIEKLVRRSLQNQTVTWRSHQVWLWGDRQSARSAL
jgi:putative ATPase